MWISLFVLVYSSLSSCHEKTTVLPVLDESSLTRLDDLLIFKLSGCSFDISSVYS